jgi:hypothetical protein
MSEYVREAKIIAATRLIVARGSERAGAAGFSDEKRERNPEFKKPGRSSS